MAPRVMDVLDAAETARASGSVFLCGELLQLAELLLGPARVDHQPSAVSRFAVEEVAGRLPIGAGVGYAAERAQDRELRHALLASANNGGWAAR